MWPAILKKKKKLDYVELLALILASYTSIVLISSYCKNTFIHRLTLQRQKALSKALEFLNIMCT